MCLNNSVDNSGIFYKGYNLKDYLAVYRSSIHINMHSYKLNLKKLVRRIIVPLSVFGSFLVGKLVYKENTFVNARFKAKYLFVVSYPVSHRVFFILHNIIKDISDRDKVIVVTCYWDVYRFYTKQSFKCVYLNLFGLSFDRDVYLRSDLNVEEIYILAKVKKYISFIERFIKEYQPKLLFTICDLHIYERAFVETAKRSGVLTITHQHGRMHPKNPIWRYTASDIVVLWGERVKRNCSEILKDTKTVVLGTDKFQCLIDKRGLYDKDYITLALNPSGDELNRCVLDQVCFQMKKLSEAEQNQYTLVLKLHPEINKQYWEDQFLVAIKRHSLRMNYRVYVYENEVVLNKSRILIAFLSTISLEAFICDVSVIDVDVSDIVKHKQALFFEDIPESIVKLDNLSTEIKKRLNDESYNKRILEKQQKSLKQEIAYFDASKRELAWIEQLIKK
jgi:hypothetical protein